MPRHWIRDVIDFSDRPHSMPKEGCDDDCFSCNRNAKEIADSLALYGTDIDYPFMEKLHDHRLDQMARFETEADYDQMARFETEAYEEII